MTFLIWFVEFVVQILTLLVIVQTFLSYFMSPYHPVREAIDRIVAPMLRPIRRVVPLVGALDFSPFILLVLIQVAGQILIVLLRSF